MNVSLPSKAHLNYLDTLRGVAALYVVWQHALLQIDPKHQLQGASRWLYVFDFGNYAVAFFIVLSGFCLMLPVIRDNGHILGGPQRFFARRAWRILPPYFCALAFSLLLIALFLHRKTGTHWDISLPVTFKSVWTHLILLHDAFDEDFTINHVLWSVAVEWRIYFLFPLLIFATQRWGSAKTTVATVLLSGLLFFACYFALGSSLSAHYLGLFALGMWAAQIAHAPHPVEARLKTLAWNRIAFFVTIAFVFLSAFSKARGDAIPFQVMDYFAGAWSSVFLVFVSQSARWQQLLSHPAGVWLGSFAYSLYLIHAPLLQLLWQGPFAAWQNSPLAMFAALLCLGTPCIVAAAYGFYLLCERPFLRRLSERKTVP